MTVFTHLECSACGTTFDAHQVQTYCAACQAPLLARSALTRFEESPERQMATSQVDFGREYPGYQWKITVADMVSVALGPDITKDMKRIDVQVTLNNGEYTYGFRTYRFKREL